MRFTLNKTTLLKILPFLMGATSGLMVTNGSLDAALKTSGVAPLIVKNLNSVIGSSEKSGRHSMSDETDVKSRFDSLGRMPTPLLRLREIVLFVGDLFEYSPDRAIAYLATLESSEMLQILDYLPHLKPIPRYESFVVEASCTGQLQVPDEKLLPLWQEAANSNIVWLKKFLDKMMSNPNTIDRIPLSSLSHSSAKAAMLNELLEHSYPGATSALDSQAGEDTSLESSTVLSLLEKAVDSPNASKDHLIRSLYGSLAKTDPEALAGLVKKNDLEQTWSIVEALLEKSRYDVAASIFGDEHLVGDLGYDAQIPLIKALAALKMAKGEDRIEKIAASLVTLENTNSDSIYGNAIDFILDNAHDPNIVISASSMFPNGPLKQEIYDRTIRNWASVDVYSAAEWVNSLTIDMRSDKMLFTIADQIPRDLERSLSWTFQATPSNERSIKLDNLLQKLTTRDQAAAEKWRSLIQVDP